MADRKSSRIVLRDDMVFTGYSSNGYSIPLDSSPSVGGHEAGIRPIELMLTALAGCTGMDVLSIMRKKKQDVTGFEVYVEGDRANDYPKVYTEIWVKFTITGHNIDPKAVERSIELSRDKYCGAAATLRHTATLHFEYEINETESVDQGDKEIVT